MFVKKDYSGEFCHRQIVTDEYYEGKPLEIGLGTQVVMGDVMVEDAYLVKQVQERPQVYSQKPIIEAEYPWENHKCNSWGILPMTVVYDPDDDLFKLWYSVLGYHEEETYDTFKNVGRADYPCLFCYAESKDGIHFINPLSEERPIGRNKATNVVFTGSECGFGGGRVLLNPRRRENPDMKYLLSYNSSDGIRIAASPDGIKWADIPGINPVIPVSYDTHTHMMYDDGRGVYQLFTRSSVFAKPESSPNEINDVNGVFRRQVCISESSDLIHWSTVRIATRAPENVRDNQCDNQATFAIGATLIGRMDRFEVTPVSDMMQMMHQYWVTGADPYNMRFVLPNEPIPHARMNGYVAASPELRGYPMYTDDNRMIFIGLYSAYNEHAGKSRVGVNYYCFGENRLVSRYADIGGGWLLTKEFVLRGSKIEVNCDTRRGELRAEIITGEGGNVRGGAYHAGFTCEDCDPITTDGYHHVLSWRGSSDLTEFVGKPIYIRFHLKETKLYSFTVLE